MSLVQIQNLLLREIILAQSPGYRWAVLISALDSLQKPIHSIVEIGVHQADCSRFLRLCFPLAHLYLVDPWELCSTYRASDGPITTKESTMEKAFDKVQNYFQDDSNTHILRKSSKEACSLVPDSIDLVFIDGNHDYDFVKEDIELWLPKIRRGGILAGHDYHLTGERFPGVKRAVDELLGSNISVGEDSVWLYSKE